MNQRLFVRENLANEYNDVYTPEAMSAIVHLNPFNEKIRELMELRMNKRALRQKNKTGISFLDGDTTIAGHQYKGKRCPKGIFRGAVIPVDLQRQWIQGTGPATKPNAPVESGLRNVAYALLSGADGWMFDGEDALGQVTTMSLDNQRNLKLAIHQQPVFLKVAEQVAGEMNAWARGFFGHEMHYRLAAAVTADHKKYSGPAVCTWPTGTCATAMAMRSQPPSLDLALYVVNNHKALQESGSSIVLYLPKIQTAEEAALWNEMISSLEAWLGFEQPAIKAYVLVEQLEATFQLMEIRAALGEHFVGFNTGRWDYINSVFGCDVMGRKLHQSEY
jgi:malate synthase